MIKKYAVSIVLCLLFVGCKGLPESAALQLRKNLVLVKKDYQEYLDKDPRYVEDQDAKQDRLGLIDDSIELIDEAVK